MEVTEKALLLAVAMATVVWMHGEKQRSLQKIIVASFVSVCGVYER